jgi:hypothetical protein
MSSNLSVAEVLSNLEQRVVFLREQEAFHGEQEAHHREQEVLHREQRALHAAELEKVMQSLEAFRAVSASAVDLAVPPAPRSRPAAVDVAKLPSSGRLMVSRLVRLAVESPELAEPFGATAVAAETSRRFRDHLREPIRPRTASDVLRRMLAEGELRLAHKGRALHEALYTRKRTGP